MTTKQQAMQKIHINELHMKLIHTREDRMHVTVKHLQCSVKGALEVCKYYATEKSMHKLIHKVAEEQDLKLGEMIYLYISSQKNQVMEFPIFGSSYKT